MLKPSNDPIFTPPPESLFQRRPSIDPGIVAGVGALAALGFLGVLLGVLEAAFDFTMADLVIAFLQGFLHLSADVADACRR
jgi:hypothetical protein